jgi:phosphate transport system permease protein
VTTTAARVTTPRRGAPPRAPRSRFRLLTATIAAIVLALLVAAAVFVVAASWPAMRHYGIVSFLTHARWAPSEATATARSPNPYGIIGFVYGTLVTSVLALLIAVPISIGVALFLNEMAPIRLRGPLTVVTELLAMVPSVVYGFWGVFALIPVLRPVALFLENTLGKVPVAGVAFRGPYFGFSYFTAAIVLAIMILPIITALSREVIAVVPSDLKEASYALGATRWETVRAVVLPVSRSGLVGASFLGLGRALGETIAVTMVIGNSVLGISKSIFGQGATMASVIANEFTEANQPFHIRSLFVVSFWLMVLTLAVNAVGRLVVGWARRT